MPLTIVTGGGRGIGAATALHLARAGHDLVVNYRSSPGSAAAVVSAAASLGVRALAVPGDVTSPSDVDGLFAAAAGLGPVTGLVTSAGLTAHIGDLASTPVSVIRTVLDVNLLGTILCARAAAQAMSGRGGAIVTISSAAATLGSPHEYVHYAAAKAGVEALTLGLSKELAGDGIRVNCVSPGIVRTTIHADAGAPDRPDTAAGRIPLGRAGEPDEIAPAIAFLLGPDSAYATGTVIRVAGGL